jgi:uncharacterized sporulation protein YeaH/YhbH (DUF444 family)
LLDRNLEVELALLEELRLERTGTLSNTSVGRYLKGNLAEQQARYEARIRELEEWKQRLEDGHLKTSDDKIDEVQVDRDTEEDVKISPWRCRITCD